MSPTEPPDSLTKEAQGLWIGICADVELSGAQLLILKTALEHYDLYQRAQHELMIDGLTVPTAHGLKTHPAATIRKAAGDSFFAAFRLLGIGLEVKEVGRPTDDRELKWQERLRAVK